MKVLFHDLQGSDPVEVALYPLTEKGIASLTTDWHCGNYIICSANVSADRGCVVARVAYVGRVDKSPIKSRLLDHLREERFKEASWYFHVRRADAPKEAYERECRDYHRFLEADDTGAFMNKIHPDRPDGETFHCPVCGSEGGGE